MIFLPDEQELSIINIVQGIQNTEYALIRLTPTMIDKNNIDANEIFRDLLCSYGLVDYESLLHGGKHGAPHDALFILPGEVRITLFNFYRVNNSRGDRRFSIQQLQRKAANKELNVGDLIYISVYRNSQGEPKLFFLNLTHNVPFAQDVRNAIGEDETTKLLNGLKPRIRDILHGGYFYNSKGPGPIAPKDVGDTFENLLGIGANNRSNADINGLIEVKTKGSDGTKDTLFSHRPSFDGTRTAEYEPIDIRRVSAFQRLYGYESPAHPGCWSLYATIGPSGNSQNLHGFYLDVNEKERRVNLIYDPMRLSSDGICDRPEIAAYWPFHEIKERLYEKHPATLWIDADRHEHNGTWQFHYKKVEFTRSPQFTTFISLVDEGIITYDWRGYTPMPGTNIKGKNHGNVWRIKPYARNQLFGETEEIKF